MCRIRRSYRMKSLFVVHHQPSVSDGFSRSLRICGPDVTADATTPEQLDASLDALTIDLSAQQRARLDEVSRPDPVMTPHSLFAQIRDRRP
jgi:hypothetical protein